MALQIKKYEPLPDLVVRGNNYQAPNLSVPAPGAPATTPNIAVNGDTSYYKPPNYASWNTPAPVPNVVQRLAQSVVNPIRNQINATGNSVLANYARIAAADVTHNDVARNNASVRLKVANQELNKRLKDPTYIAGAFSEGGGPLKAGKPKVTLNGKNIRPPEVTVKPATLSEPPDFLKTSSKYKGLSAEEKANLSSKDQMNLAALEGMGPAKQPAPAINLARNPKNPDFTTVKQGDYQVARNQPGAVAHPIRTVQRLWDSSMQKLNPDEFSNFWRYAEKPPKDASPQLQDALHWWREGTDRVHANTVPFKNTNYLNDFALHPWKLKDVTEEQLVSGGPGVLGQHAITRKYRTIAEGEKAGLNLGNNPLEEGHKYFSGAASALERQVAKKSLAEADAGEATKTRTLDLGYGHTVPLSEKGYKKSKAFEYYTPSTNKAVRGLRTTNAALKTSILSAGQFHPFNISVLRAGPSIALAGHPINAVKGVARTFRPLLPGGKGAVNRILTKAYNDGSIDKAARIGMPYGQAGYNVAGTSLKSGVGHKMVFERQMPMMHDQVARSIISDLEKRNIPLESPAAHQAGVAGNATMGFINKEALNISPKLRQKMSDFLLAGQFTPSKIVTISKIAKGGVAGKYARSDVISNVAAATALITGIGYAVNQESDNAKDMVLRALVNPAVPTPYKDKKGNTDEVRIPLTYTAEMAKLLGIKLARGQDGHLGIDWQPSKALKADGTLYEWMKSRLSPGASTVVKLATNKNFLDKPVYDPTAPAGTKAIQAATTIGQGYLPIGAQGLAYTDAVKKHLPGSAQEVLDAGTPGSNPVLKSGLGSIGFSPRTDQTVGKAKDAATYFNAVDKYGKGLDRQSKDAFDLWTGSKKNPVTGKYDVAPSIDDARTKASALLQNPKALNNLISLNQSLAKQGQQTDPLWALSKDNITKYLQYQNMEPGGSSRSDWYDKNQGWYQPLSDARGKFFTSLPPGDPNKPKLDLQYPEASSDVKGLMEQYSNITDSKQKGQFIDDHPDLVKQWNAQSDYTNQVRQRLGYSPLKKYPEATTRMQSFIDSYNGASKQQRKLIRNSDPKSYQEMIAYYDSVDLYNIGKQASKSQLQGQPDYTSKEAGAISSLAKDIYQSPDGTYQIVPAGWMQGLSNDSSSGGSSGGYSSSHKKGYSSRSRSSSGSRNSGSSRSSKVPSVGSEYKYAISLNAGGKAKRPKVTVRSGATKAKSSGASKPKVSIKASKV